MDEEQAVIKWEKRFWHNNLDSDYEDTYDIVRKELEELLAHLPKGRYILGVESN